MSYTLTLTLAERKEIDWVGHRYWHGNQLFTLLWPHGSRRDWDNPEPITFRVPEHVAWIIREEAEAAHYAWDCFGEELAEKLNHFVDSIV